MKKAQISMFVIIGIILLFAAGMFFFISNELQENKPVVDVPEVSLETRPAVQLVESCLESTGELAIREVLAQGGVLNARGSFISHRSSGVIREPHTIPFWRYMDEDNGCTAPYGCPATERPPLCKISTSNQCNGLDFGQNSIQEQIETYILENIDTCIDELASLSDFFDLEISQDRELESFLSGGQTTFVMTNELTAVSRSTENTKSVEEFRAVLDVDLLEFYDIATSTLEFIELTNYYETQTMDLISVYSCGNSDCLPPTDQLSLARSSSAIWVQQDVQDKLETEVLPLIALTSYINFDNYDLLERPDDEDFGVYNPYIDGLYASFSPHFGSERFVGYDLNHYYLYSPIRFQIDDGDQIIKPKKVDMSSTGLVGDLLSFGFSDMRFNYFMTYPLVLSITDKEAFNGAGLDLNFAIEVNIIGNRPGYQGVNVYNTGSGFSTSLDSPQQLVDREIVVRTTNKYTGEPLEEVSVNYVCLDEYEIGITTFTVQNIAELVTKLPHCEFGGFFELSKQGYESVSLPFNNPEGASDALLDVALWPLVEKEIIVYKRSVKDIVDVLSAGVNGVFVLEQAYSLPDAHQTIIVTLDKIKNSPFEDSIPPVGVGIVDSQLDYSEFTDLTDTTQQLELVDQLRDTGQLTQSEADLLKEQLANFDFPNELLETLEPESIKMEFVPGEYSLELTMFDYGYTDDVTGEYIYPVDVPEGVIQGNSGFLGIGSTDDVTLDPVQLSTWVSGGGFVDIQLTEQRLYESDEPLVFYALEMPVPTRWNCDYLAATNPGFSSCNDVGFCGVYDLGNDDVYCVPFDDVQNIEDFQLDKKFMIAPDTLS